MSWKPGQPVRITTPRFVLRSMTPADVTPKFLRWQNDRELRVGQNLNRPRMTRDMALRTVRGADNARVFYLQIGATFAEVPIGFYAVNVDQINKVAETIVVIGDREYWGKKVVLETRAALLDFLFDEAGMHKVMGKPHARNLASIFNYRAQGFTCEGVLREQLISIEDGSRLDEMMFAMLRSDWHRRREAQT